MIKLKPVFQLIEIIIADLSAPVATMADISNMETMKTQHDDICEKIKTIRENYFEFCEDETQFNTDMVSIEKDPEPYSDGTIKTKLILKKYACALLDKNEVEVRMKDIVSDERTNITLEKFVEQQKKLTKLEKQLKDQQYLLDEQQYKLNKLIRLFVDDEDMKTFKTSTDSESESESIDS